MYTSLKLSKLLAENGFEEETEAYHHDNTIDLPMGHGYPLVRKYDILNDLCVKYVKEIFGEEDIGTYMDRGEREYLAFREHPVIIIEYLQDNKQEEAEEYIWEHCKFNPNNK